EGILQGRRQEAPALTIRLLKRRFGGIEPSMKEVIGELSLDSLERLGEDLLEFEDDSALVKWLNEARKSDNGPSH
ncbi:MAG: DUF4351 domain-containing protein, partial [Pseudomonadota bacterium]